MTVGDYLFSAFLILLIFRQIRGRRLTILGLLLPLGIVVAVAISYLKGFPTAGNDLNLAVATALIGAVLGVLSAVATSVTPGPDGIPIAKAGLAAIILWILGTGSRLAFGLYATHGGGYEIAHLSRQYHITGSQAWATALVLMALTEVIGRFGVLAVRGFQARRGHPLPGNRSGSPVGYPQMDRTVGPPR
jgi:hypothetical protein